MDEPERAFRDGLERHAERADVKAPVVAGARAAVARRRRTRVVLVAAAVLIVAGSGIAVAVGRSGGDPVGVAGTPAPTGDVATDPATAKPSVLGPTRTEYWHNVQVDVPAGWQLGEVPASCAEAPVGVPYVGRPLSNTDGCGADPAPDATPTAPYVWLGAGGSIGSTDLGEGWVRETILVDGTPVSVASQDPGLRRDVLATARRQDLCAPELTDVPRAKYESTVEGVGPFVDARLCAYAFPDTEGGQRLVYARSLTEHVAEATFAAVEAAPPAEEFFDCGLGEVVTVGARYHDSFGAPDARLRRTDVFQLSCGVASRGPFDRDSTMHALTEATVRPWARGGEFRHLLVGPGSAGWSSRYFRGMLG